MLGNFSQHFGLSKVEGKQSIIGKRSGTRWTVDAKGFCQGSEAFVVVECRRHTTSKQDQEQLGGLAYRILDTGADSGILISPLGFQSGAKKVADAERIIHVELDPNSTSTEFVMRFINQLFVGVHERCDASEFSSAELVRVCKKCGDKFSVHENEFTCSECSKTLIKRFPHIS